MDGGVYTCFATNEYGMVIHGTFLKVKAVGKWKGDHQEVCDEPVDGSLGRDLNSLLQGLLVSFVPLRRIKF